MIKVNTAQLISISTGILACTWGELYDALNAITGDELYSHQLPRASFFIENYTKEIYPWLFDLPELPDEVNKKTMLEWVENISQKHGYEHEVPDLSDKWESREPMAELMEMFSNEE